MRAFLCAALCAPLCACSVGESYLVEPRYLDAAARLDPAARAHSVVPAARLPHGTATHVRADTLVDEPRAEPARVRTRVYSPRITAGVVLTCLGSALSVAGTLMYFVAHGDTSTAGAIMAGSAEPIMLAGTLLWILGGLKRPQEVPPGRPDLHYLDSP